MERTRRPEWVFAGATRASNRTETRRETICCPKQRETVNLSAPTRHAVKCCEDVRPEYEHQVACRDRPSIGAGAPLAIQDQADDKHPGIS
jgi:hypothetical protein